MSMPYIKFATVLFIFLLSGLCHAKNHNHAHSHHHQLDDVVVSSPTQESLFNVAQPVTVIDKAMLDDSHERTLGALLGSYLGISNASFGAGVGRPVLRGMSGHRVKTLSNGHDCADLSAMSSDHAPMTEVANAHQIEVLQGPATLLYGNGAIGGVINVLDKKIHQRPFSGLHGVMKFDLSSVNQGREVAAELDAGRHLLSLHLDGFYNTTEDYQAVVEGKNKTVENSHTHRQGGSVGISISHENTGYLGFAVSLLDYQYAVPNEKNLAAEVTPKQTRYELKGGLYQPTAWIDAWHNSLSINQYQHEEVTKPIVEGLFKQDSLEFSSHLQHTELLGLKGTLGVHYKFKNMSLCHNHSGCFNIPDYSQQSWNGLAGGLFKYQHGYALAHDTPMPITQTQDIGYFWIEKSNWQLGNFAKGHVEFGARIDTVTIKADPNSINLGARKSSIYYSDKHFLPLSLFLAGSYHINPRQRLALSLARAQRAPDATEMYWNGNHHATFAYQLDNPDLIEESAYSADINWRYSNKRQQIMFALFYYHFENYIYNQPKGFNDPYHANPVYRYEQVRAAFKGGELSYEQPFTPYSTFMLGADYVSAKRLDSTHSPLPRIPAPRLKLGINMAYKNMRASLVNDVYLEQNKVGKNETKSPSYQNLKLSFGYQKDSKNYSIKSHLSISNGLNQAGKNHVSYLKEYAPIQARNISLNTQIQFW